MGSNTNTLTKQRASELLKDLIKDESCILQISAGAEKGDGLLSSITKVTIKTNNELLHLVIKLAGDNEALRKMIAVRTIFCREIHFYDTILPAFISLQTERNISDPFNSVARCFKTCSESGKEMLVLEDIRQQGFDMWDVQKSLMDDEHITLLFKEYAKLHALSFSMQDHNMDLYKELTKDMDEIWNKLNEKYIYEVLKAADKVQNLFDCNSDIYNVLGRFNTSIVGFIAMLETTTLKYNAILHGDCWCNNLMFKYMSDDYISIRMNNGGGQGEDTIGAALLGKNAPPLHVPADAGANDKELLTEAQLPPYPSNTTPSDGAWQTVNGTRYKFYVFSAFFDNRKSQRSVRVIGATKTRGPERVWCRLWYRGSDGNNTNYISKTVFAKIKVIRENWNLKYSACFILCPLQRNQSVPAAVSIVTKIKLPPANLLTVTNNFNETKPKNKFAVCVKPLHFDYNRALQILEFIELNRIMGVEHFTFYNHTVGKQVGCILEDYVNRGIVSLLPWQLNMVSQKEIRTEGLFAALNDCLYRSMYKYSHVLLIDLDEYIIPRHNDTLPQLIDWLSMRINTRTTGSFSFQNAFFYLQWGDGDWVYESHDSVATGLVTLKKVRRKTKLHPHKQRSKYICKPELVVEAGNHFVWEYIPGHGTFNVPADSAILQHYRICEFGGDDCINTASTVDTTAFRYKDRLVASVKERYNVFKHQCNLYELPPPPERGFDKIFKIFKSDDSKGR